MPTVRGSTVRYMTLTMSVTLPHFLLQPFLCSLSLSLSPLPPSLSQRPVGLRRETCHKFRLITSSSFFQFSLQSIFSAKQIDFCLVSLKTTKANIEQKKRSLESVQFFNQLDFEPVLHRSPFNASLKACKYKYNETYSAAEYG